MIMNKLIYSSLFAFCLGYLVNDFMPGTNLFPITSAHADAANHNDVAEIDIGALLQDLEFRQAVKEIVEDCIVDDNEIHC